MSVIPTTFPKVMVTTDSAGASPNVRIFMTLHSSAAGVAATRGGRTKRDGALARPTASMRRVDRPVHREEHLARPVLGRVGDVSGVGVKGGGAEDVAVGVPGAVWQFH